MAVLLHLVWFKVKLHVKDPKTVSDKKKYVAFWLERYAKKEPGMPLTVVFDMTESGLSNIVSVPLQVYPFYFLQRDASESVKELFPAASLKWC